MSYTAILNGQTSLDGLTVNQTFVTLWLLRMKEISLARHYAAEWRDGKKNLDLAGILKETWDELPSLFTESFEQANNELEESNG